MIEEGGNKEKIRPLYKDIQTDFNEIIMKTKEIKPHFTSDMGKRAHYANINFEILGKIIEIDNLILEDVYRQLIFEPLGLKNTYFPVDEEDFIPHIY